MQNLDFVAVKTSKEVFITDEIVMACTSDGILTFHTSIMEGGQLADKFAKNKTLPGANPKTGVLMSLNLPVMLHMGSDFMLNNIALSPQDGSEILACVRSKTAYLIRLVKEGPTIVVTYTLENKGEEMIYG